MRFWMDWIASFLIVIAILMILAGLQEYWEWRKENRK